MASRGICGKWRKGEGTGAGRASTGQGAGGAGREGRGGARKEKGAKGGGRKDGGRSEGRSKDGGRSEGRRGPSRCRPGMALPSRCRPGMALPGTVPAGHAIFTGYASRKPPLQGHMGDLRKKSAGRDSRFRSSASHIRQKLRRTPPTPQSRVRERPKNPDRRRRVPVAT